MKQSLDENTITLKNGRTFQAVKMVSESCGSCAFSSSDCEDYCYGALCFGFDRDDGQDVYFVEVKNENQ